MDAELLRRSCKRMPRLVELEAPLGIILNEMGILTSHVMNACEEAYSRDVNKWRQLHEDRRSLKAVVDLLPRLADGTYWIPGRDDGHLWHPEIPHFSVGCDIKWDGEEWSIQLGILARVLVSTCYRTEAEARAAAEKEAT